MDDVEKNLACILAGMILLIFVLVVAFLKKNNIERVGQNNAGESDFTRGPEGK